MKRLLPLLLLLAGGCVAERPGGSAPGINPQPATQTALPTRAEQAPYQFDRPDVSVALPSDLEEISGLTLLPDGRLGAVQDEDGLLFILNHETGAVEARYPFGKTGDYEALERVGDQVLVLRSNGTLFEITGWADPEPRTRAFKTGLKKKNDTEGLAYDAANHRLLIACKEQPGGDLPGHQKAIYAFDLTTGALSDAPVFRLDRNELEQQMAGGQRFKPSALAVHPVHGELYVLSSIAQSIAVLGPDGSLRQVWKLSERMFEKPEGLAFLPDGTLFISSEGDEGPAMLYRFGYSGPS